MKRHRYSCRFMALAVLSVMLFNTSVRADDRDPVAVLKPLMEQFVATAKSIDDYRVTMTKQQFGDGKLQPMETLALKHRRADDCRYLRWTEAPSKGREVLFCPGRYEGKVKVREPGMLGMTLSLSPDSSLLRMKGNLRPIQDTGVFNFAELIEDDLASAATPEGPAPSLIEREVHGQASVCLRREQGESTSTHYQAGARELCFEKDSALPTEAVIWDRSGQLMEHFTFRDFRTNVGLTDADFDADNPEYGF